MKYPYAISSDQHFHDWSAFAGINERGENTRLVIQLAEMQRCVEELLAAGGDTLFLAGDLFHVRGKIDPEVFNPVHSKFGYLSSLGLKVHAIPGNHDLKGKTANELGNAIQTLSSISNFYVSTIAGCGSNPHNVVMVPWQPTVETARREIKVIADALGSEAAQWDLIIHAPVNDVIIGVPNTGFSMGELADFGFKRVFAGHYHNHKRLDDGTGPIGREVYSIGATTHQTWSDIGTKAGFLLVYEDRVEWRASHAPSFVEINADTDPDEIPLIVDGNYVRVKFDSLTEKEVKLWREELAAMGAKGSVVMASKAPAVSRGGSTATSGATLESSIGGFIKGLGHPREAELTSICLDILSAARSVA